MLLTKFCKVETSAYDKLQNETGYFDAPAKAVAAPINSKQQAKLTWKNIPQTTDALVARLNADKARVDSMTDKIGQEIVRDSIAKLSAFLTANNVAF